MLSYAFGQLINGRLGDKIKGRYMISLGTIIAGICNVLMAFFTSNVFTAIVYGISGFCLSMIYGPLTKIISENVCPFWP
jgi:sugar phosphate permease